MFPIGSEVSTPLLTPSDAILCNHAGSSSALAYVRIDPPAAAPCWCAAPWYPLLRQWRWRESTLAAVGTRGSSRGPGETLPASPGLMPKRKAPRTGPRREGKQTGNLNPNLMAPNQPPSNKEQLLVLGLTATWVANEGDVSLTQCYGCGEEVDADYVLTFWERPACGEQFDLPQLGEHSAEEEG